MKKFLFFSDQVSWISDKIIRKAGISYEEVNPFEEKIESAEEYDLDQGDRIVNPPYITEKMAIRFFSMFLGKRRCICRKRKERGLFFHSVRIVGMTGFALNNVKRKCFVMNVKILNG